MKKLILVANWKNAPSSHEEAQSLLKGLGKKRLVYKKLHTFIAPPLTYFESVSGKASGYAKLGAQDLFPEEKGRFTGSVGVDILKNFGVRVVILGHSERRALGETSEEVARKVRVALRAGFTPLVCFGELSREQDGEHFEFIREELQASLAGLKKSELSKIILAYEPIWAIGKNAIGVIDPESLSEVAVFVKKVLTDLFGRAAAESVPLLYGGSVDGRNAGILTKNTGVSGFLVGRASLSPESFAEVAEAMLQK